jgi:hypothetical protein
MESLCYLLAQPYQLPASQTITKTDADGTGTVVAITAQWYRTRLAPIAGTGTEADPAELLYTVSTLLGALWTCEMGTDGRVVITYIGTGTGDLGVTATLRALLGYSTASPPAPLATSGTWTATYQPTHCVFAAAADDEGWQSVQGRAAVQEMPDGSTYGWQDARTRLTRRITLTMLPRDDTARTTLGSLSTPAIAETAYRLDPGASAPAQAPPWSVSQTLATAVGARCGWTDDLQAIITGTTTAFDAVYLGAESHTAPTSLSIPGYDPRRSIGPLLLSWAATESA